MTVVTARCSQRRISRDASSGVNGSLKAAALVPIRTKGRRKYNFLEVPVVSL